ncbi:MAG: glycosyltransferase family 2 protein [Pseudomonadota bacterium]
MHHVFSTTFQKAAKGLPSAAFLRFELPMTIPLSVFIITKNEEVRILRTLQSVREWAAEVIVVDSGSTDRTVEIAKSNGARVLHNDWTGYGPQKRFAEEQCTNRWVLNIDADEVVSPDLAVEIIMLFTDKPDGPEPAGYNVPILNVYPGDIYPRPFANDYNVVRLYHLDAGRYRDHPVYDRVEIDTSKVGQLKAALFHHSIVDWEHMVDKANRITSHEIDRVARKSSFELRLRLVTEFPLMFVRAYIFRRHVFGGWKGFVFALNAAFLRTMRIAKALERKQSSAT